MDPEDRKYTKEHEWVKMEGEMSVVGITHHAQEQLGDIVFLELPKPGDRVTQFKPLGVVESVKAASDIFSPMSGTVVEVNAKAVAEPQIVNQSPYGDGWLIRLHPDDLAELDALMTAQQYGEHVGG